MVESPFVQAALTEVVWVVAGFALGLVLSLGAIALLTMGRRVPVAVMPLGVGAVGLSAVVAGVAGQLQGDAYTGVLAALVVRFLAGFAVLPVGGVVLLGTALLGVRGERDLRAPAAVLGLVALAAGFSFAEGYVGGNTPFGAVRAGLIAGTGVLVAVSAVSQTAPTPFATASLVWALMVATLEGAGRGLTGAFALVVTVRVVDVPKREEAVDRMLAHVGGQDVWMWATLLAAAAVVLLAARLDFPPERRGRAVALVWLLALPVLLLAGVPGRDALVGAAESAPPPQVQPAP